MTAYGLMRKRPDDRDYAFKPPITWDDSVWVDLAASFPERPYDQGQLGSCVSNGAAGCADFARVKMGLPPMDRPSRLFLYYEGRRLAGYPLNQDTGLQIRDGFNALAKSGAAHETLWAYDIERFAERPTTAAYDDGALNQALAYGSVQADQIDDAIASGYPVCFGFNVYESFEASSTASTGIMPVPDRRRESIVGGHCMVFTSVLKHGSEIKGANPSTWYRKARNSWGLSWGLPDDPGHVWFPADEVTNGDSSDFWVVTTMEDGNAPEPPGPAPDPLVTACRAAKADPKVAAWLRGFHLTRNSRAVTDRMAAIFAATPED